MNAALIVDPPAEVVAIDRVGLRHAGIGVAFDVFQESAETFLPLVGAGSHVQPGSSSS